MKNIDKIYKLAEKHPKKGGFMLQYMPKRGIFEKKTSVKNFVLTLLFLASLGLNKSLAQCPAPATLSSGNLSYFSANITWANVSGAGSYDIRYRVFGTTQWITINNVSSPYTLLNLQSLTKYQYSVRAVCNGTNGTYSAIKLFTTLVAPCNLPGNLGSSAITATTAQLSWQNNSSGLLNLVRYRLQGSNVWSNDSTTGSSITLQNLIPQGNYEWTVQQKCSSTNFSPVTAIQSFTTLAPTGVCPSVINLLASGITSSSANVTWNNNPNALSFEVYYRLIGSGSWQQANTTATSILLTNLIPQSQYEVNVKAICSSGTDNSGSNLGFSTLGNNCVSALNASAGNISTTSAQITWTPGWNDNHYSVLYRKTGTLAWDSISSLLPSASLSGLISGVSYEYYIRTYCNTGSSGSNNPSSFYTIATSCGIPAGLNFNNLTYQSANIFWTSLSGAISYELRYRVFGTSVWTTVPVSSNSYLLSGLLPFTKYQYAVRAVCSGLTGSYSAIKLFTTLAAPCLAPQNLVLNNLTENSALINWTPQNTGIGFRFQYRITGNSGWVSDSTLNTNYPLINLTPNTAYE